MAHRGGKGADQRFLAQNLGISVGGRAAGAKKPKKPKQPRLKNDPKYIAAARELRDRFLEELERNPRLLDPGKTEQRYDVSRSLSAAPTVLDPPRLLAAA